MGMGEYEKSMSRLPSPGTHADMVGDFPKTPHPNAEVCAYKHSLPRNMIGRVGAWSLTSRLDTALASLKNSWAWKGQVLLNIISSHGTQEKHGGSIAPRSRAPCERRPPRLELARVAAAIEKISRLLPRYAGATGLMAPIAVMWKT